MDLRSDKRQKARKTRDSSSADRGEAQETRRREIESLPAFHEPKSPADTERIMEEIGEWENLKEAMWRGKSKKEGGGVDGRNRGETPPHPEFFSVLDQHLRRDAKHPPPKQQQHPQSHAQSA